MTRRFFLIGILSLSLSFVVGARAPIAQAGGDGFVGGIADLPLMTDLTEDPDTALVFETPEGRIVEVDATGKLDADTVRGFYDQTLPQLGWKKQGPDRFAREGESLKLDFSSSSGETRVRFRLGPNTD